MDTWVQIDGRIIPGDAPAIPVLDRGFLFGDSVYEVVRTYGRRPFLFAEHLERLEASAARLAIPLPGGRARIEASVEETLRHVLNQVSVEAGHQHDHAGDEWYIRIIVTRGTSPPSLDPTPAGPPRLIVIVRPFVPPDRTGELHGTTARIVSTRRSSRTSLDPAIKSGNYLNNILAHMEARQAGARDAIMLNVDGDVTEAPTANVFAVHGEGVSTPSLDCGILAGITRSLLIDTARRSAIPVEEKRLLAEDLARADELFFTSTLREIQPVIELDGRPIGRTTPGGGPVTRRLAALLSTRISELAQPHGS